MLPTHIAVDGFRATNTWEPAPPWPSPTAMNRSTRTGSYRMTDRDTLEDMGIAVSVRLDDEATVALRLLEASGLTRSEAIRQSLLHSAARLRRTDSLRAEVAALEADAADRAELAAIAALMDDLRAQG